MDNLDGIMLWLGWAFACYLVVAAIAVGYVMLCERRRARARRRSLGAELEPLRLVTPGSTSSAGASRRPPGGWLAERTLGERDRLRNESRRA